MEAKMKITRRQLQRLINEAIYKLGRPPRTLDYELKMFDQERERSNARIDSMLSPRARDNLAEFDENDPDYAEVFRLGLDPDRPEIRRVKQTFDNVIYSSPGFGYGRRPHGLEIEIPQELVNDVIDAHLDVQVNPSNAGRFRQAAIRVIDYIDDKVAIMAERDDESYTVEHYGYEPRGHRAREYEEAMEAAGEYL